MRTCLLFVVALAMSSTMATAQEAEKAPETIVWNGTAFSWPVGDRDKFKDGDPIHAWDVVAAFNDQTLIEADCAKYSVNLKGATWCFANAKNLAAFKAATDKDGDNKMVPKHGGRCVLGTSWGIAAAKGDPRTFRLIDGELVLQSHNKWWTTFDADRSTNFRLASMSMRIYRTMHLIVQNDKLPANPKAKSK